MGKFRDKLKRMLKVYVKSRGYCIYCGNKHRISDYKVTWNLDHFIPKRKSEGLGKANLFVACIECNTMKGNLCLEAYRIHRWGDSKQPFFFELMKFNMSR